jgi:hypothetical protein
MDRHAIEHAKNGEETNVENELEKVWKASLDLPG